MEKQEKKFSLWDIKTPHLLIMLVFLLLLFFAATSATVVAWQTWDDSRKLAAQRNTLQTRLEASLIALRTCQEGKSSFIVESATGTSSGIPAELGAPFSTAHGVQTPPMSAALEPLVEEFSKECSKPQGQLVRSAPLPAPKDEKVHAFPPKQNMPSAQNTVSTQNEQIPALQGFEQAKVAPAQAFPEAKNSYSSPSATPSNQKAPSSSWQAHWRFAKRFVSVFFEPITSLF